jgi:hypothetical protein
MANTLWVGEKHKKCKSSSLLNKDKRKTLTWETEEWNELFPLASMKGPSELPRPFRVDTIAPPESSSSVTHPNSASGGRQALRSLLMRCGLSALSQERTHFFQVTLVATSPVTWIFGQNWVTPNSASPVHGQEVYLVPFLMDMLYTHRLPS